MPAEEPADAEALPADTGLRITSTDVLTTGHNRRVRVVRLEGEADHTQRHRLEKALTAALASRPALLLVDLTALAFCDSSGLNAFVHARRNAQESGVALVLAAPTEPVDRLLEITGMYQVFDIRPDVETALAEHPGP
ncbi:STAS domain-containing protein [Kitasatospora phosalacinea]|uniref:STAS domain-containing protein n=1 Tax=Kitasatospora phosalacinea TaxID=2065 RepID=UPI00365BDBCE